MVYYIVTPMAWKFFVSFEMLGDGGALPIELEPRISEYLSLMMRLIFAFGLAFELPVILLLLARAGLVTHQGLAEKRKVAIVVSFVAAAILTPPDVISDFYLPFQLLLSTKYQSWGRGGLAHQKTVNLTRANAAGGFIACAISLWTVFIFMRVPRGPEPNSRPSLTMHDIRLIRETPDDFDAALKRRNLPPMAKKILQTDIDRRALQAEIQDMRSRRNIASKDIGVLKANGSDANELIAQVNVMKAKLPH